MCVSLCGFVDGEPKKGSYHQHLRPASACQEGLLCLLWHEDHIKSSACENLRDRKRRMKRVS